MFLISSFNFLIMNIRKEIKLYDTGVKELFVEGDKHQRKLKYVTHIY